MQKELTNKQRTRQDYVDCKIFECVNDLMPTNQKWDWYDLEKIGQVRDAIQDIIVDWLGLCTEQEFYPYLAEEKIEKSNLPDVISIEWSTDDVKQIVDERREGSASEKEIKKLNSLTDNDLRKILDIVKDRHDCNYGITWDTLRSAISYYVN
jgi:hypothetical protein